MTLGKDGMVTNKIIIIIIEENNILSCIFFFSQHEFSRSLFCNTVYP